MDQGFDDRPLAVDAGLSRLSALRPAAGGDWRDSIMIVLVAVIVIGGLEALLRGFHVPFYVMPPPSVIATTAVVDFPFFLPHIVVTLEELLVGFAIGASVGFLLAMAVTQFPLVEKVITPYVLLLVTTPMLALVPLLILKLGFGLAPRIVAVALASGPMVMINASTGFRRVDHAKVALAQSFGANKLQVFLSIRIPMAMPMVIVGLMVGAIFGLLTAVGAEMVGGQDGIGSRLTYYSSLIQMPQFFACILILALIGLAMNLFFKWLGRRLAGWEA